MGEFYQLGSAKTEIQEDSILFQWPLRSIEVPFQDIQGYFTYPFVGNKTMLVIAYKTEKKTKRLNLPLEPGQTKPFLEKLKGLAPASANLLDKEKKEALRILGASDQIKLSLLILSIIFPVILLVMFLPSLWHGFFDSKLAQTTIEDIYIGNVPDSNYLSFEATLGDRGLIVNRYRLGTGMESRMSTRTRKGYYPLLPRGWQQGQPVKAVLLVDERYLDTIAAQQGQVVQITGLVRNILWEGVSFTWKDRLSKQVQSPVEDLVLVDYQTSPKKERVRAFWMMGILMAMGIGIGVVMVVKTRRQRS